MTDWHEYRYTRKLRTDRIRHLPKPPPGYYWRDNGTTSYWLRTDEGPQGGVGFVEATGHGFEIYYAITGANLPDEKWSNSIYYPDMQSAAQRLIDMALKHNPTD